MDPLRFEPLNLKSCILIATQKPKFTMEWRDPLRKSDLGDCHKLSSALGLWMSTTFLPIPYPKDGEKGIFTDFGPNWQSGWGPQLTTTVTKPAFSWIRVYVELSLGQTIGQKLNVPPIVTYGLYLGPQNQKLGPGQGLVLDPYRLIFSSESGSIFLLRSTLHWGSSFWLGNQVELIWSYNWHKLELIAPSGLSFSHGPLEFKGSVI